MYIIESITESSASELLNHKTDIQVYLFPFSLAAVFAPAYYQPGMVDLSVQDYSFKDLSAACKYASELLQKGFNVVSVSRWLTMGKGSEFSLRLTVMKNGSRVIAIGRGVAKFKSEDHEAMWEKIGTFRFLGSESKYTRERISWVVDWVESQEQIIECLEKMLGAYVQSDGIRLVYCFDNPDMLSDIVDTGQVIQCVGPLREHEINGWRIAIGKEGRKKLGTVLINKENCIWIYEKI